MSTLSVLKFATPEGAGQMLDLVKSLTKQQLIVIEDAAIVSWPNGAKKPKTQQLVSMAGAGALGGGGLARRRPPAGARLTSMVGRPPKNSSPSSSMRRR